MPRFLTFNELCQAEDRLPNDEQISYLLEAVTDWPTFNLQEPGELVAALTAELDMPLTYEALSQYAHGLSELWKREAICSLLRLFAEGQEQPDQKVVLESILDELTARVRGRLQ